MKRPLLRVALIYTGGILAAGICSIPSWLLLGLSLGATLLAVTLSRVRPALLYAVLPLAGWTNYALHTAVLSPYDLRRVLGPEPHLISLRGNLRETPTLRLYETTGPPSWRTMARVDVTELRLEQGDWQPAKGCIAIGTPGILTNLFGGQTVEVTGVGMLPRIAVAEGTFDYRAYLRQQGIYYQLQSESQEDWTVLRSPARPPLADRFREWGRKALARGLPDEDESLRLEWALTLGWKTALTEQASEPFIQAATYHIFAVDGLRMAIIFGILFGLLRVVGIPRAWCGVMLLPVLWFYVALTGWPASAIRATVMLSVVIGGWVLKRPSDLLNSLFCAALLILLWEPQQLFQAGFQLSFFVVLCLILMLPPMFKLWQRLTAGDPLLPRKLRRRWPEFVVRPVRYVGDVLLTSFAAWLGSIPLVAYYFHIVTPVSTPANLLAVPLCALVLVSNLASLLTAGWLPALSILFNHAGWFLMEIIRVTSVWFAGWPRAWFYAQAPTLFTSGLYYGLLLGWVTGWLLKPAFRLWKICATSSACVCWLALWLHAQSCTKITVLPVNGGISIFCDLPGRKNKLLADTGNTNGVQFITKPFLAGQGVNALPLLLLTHGDVHHTGGAETLAREFPVHQVCAPPSRFRSAPYRKMIQRFNDSGRQIHALSRNDSVGNWKVLHPEATDRFPRADDNALVLQGKAGSVRFLLLSDLGQRGQEALLERTADLRADVVVAGLPANSEPVSDALLDALKPRLLIIADSEFPASERASAALHERLSQRRFPIIYTQSAGAATLEVRGDACVVRTMNGEQWRLKSRP